MFINAIKAKLKYFRLSFMAVYEKLFDHLYVVFTGLKGLEEFINTYLLTTSHGRAIVIDPGPRNSVERVYGVLRELGLEKSLKYIIVTHVHLDHVGGASKLAKLTEATIAVHPRGLIHIRDPVSLWESSKKVQGDVVELYGMPDKGEDVEILEARDGETITLDDVDLEIIHTPGHASHHISIFWASKSILFAGDATGFYIPEIDVIIPDTPPPFRYNLYIESLKKMIKKKPSIVARAHRGITYCGEENLIRHYNQMESWLKTLSSISEEALEDMEHVINRLAEADPMLKKFLESYSISKYGLFIKGMLNIRIQSFYEEVKRLKYSK
jgi:glyoxylase-like metal-dependent hydrolase (beta-lactamase superfamily II)